MDAEAVCFPDSSFDVVTNIYSLMFCFLIPSASSWRRTNCTRARRPPSRSPVGTIPTAESDSASVGVSESVHVAVYDEQHTGSILVIGQYEISRPACIVRSRQSVNVYNPPSLINSEVAEDPSAPINHSRLPGGGNQHRMPTLG